MLQIQLDNFPCLETDRLRLRLIHADDAEALFYLRTHDQVMQYIERPRPQRIEDAVKTIQDFDLSIEQGTGIVWGISLHSTSNLIGTIGYHRMKPEHFRAEIGYMLHPAYGSMGFMSEAIRAVIKYGFQEMQLHSIEADINPLNDRSRQLLLKHGFRKEAYFRENFYFNGRFFDSEIYSLIISDWEAGK